MEESSSDQQSGDRTTPPASPSDQPLEEASTADGESTATSTATPRSAYLSASSSRCSSPIASVRQRARHVRSNSFQRWRRQMQRAWRWGPAGGAGNCSSSSSRDQGIKTTWNLELLANQKRQWYQIQSKAKDHKQHKEPTSLFEQFFIVGLHSYANIEAIEDAFAKRKTLESEVAKSEILDLRKLHIKRICLLWNLRSFLSTLLGREWQRGRVIYLPFVSLKVLRNIWREMIYLLSSV